jgi:hypothetical protein
VIDKTAFINGTANKMIYETFWERNESRFEAKIDGVPNKNDKFGTKYDRAWLEILSNHSEKNIKMTE